MPFEIKVAEPDEWEKKHGRKAKPISKALLTVLESAFNDGKHRSVVVPDAEVEELKKELQRAAKQLGVTCSKQVQDDAAGYKKVIFKVGQRVLRPRKETVEL